MPISEIALHNNDCCKKNQLIKSKLLFYENVVYVQKLNMNKARIIPRCSGFCFSRSVIKHKSRMKCLFKIKDSEIEQ